jgi:AcrR family transcriptional regulator
MSSLHPPQSSPGIRERRAADLKLRIVDLVTEALESRTFNEVTVDELCERALTSKVTFFRYFSTKEALLAYHNSVWTYRMKAHCLLSDLRGVAALRHLFLSLGESFNRNTNLFAYFFTLSQHLSSGGDRPVLGPAERLVLHPDGSTLGLEITSSLGDFIQHHVAAARGSGEIRTDLSWESQVSLFGALLNGSGLLGMRIDPTRPGDTFETTFTPLLALLQP